MILWSCHNWHDINFWGHVTCLLSYRLLRAYYFLRVGVFTVLVMRLKTSIRIWRRKRNTHPGTTSTSSTCFFVITRCVSWQQTYCPVTKYMYTCVGRVKLHLEQKYSNKNGLSLKHTFICFLLDISFVCRS